MDHMLVKGGPSSGSLPMVDFGCIWMTVLVPMLERVWSR